MKLVNIFNSRRTLYLFCRDEDGILRIKTTSDFFPYFYEPDGEGRDISYNGIPLRKIIVSEPSAVPKQRSNNAFEADILFTKRYVIDKVGELEKCPIKYAFIDIEVLAEELPNVQDAKYPVSCISVYNSMTKFTQTFYLEDYENEYTLLDDFIEYMKKEQFDLWLSWNVKFDYNYLFYRIPDFAEKISIIGKSRYGDGEVFYPAGISIVDYLGWYKKVTFNREKSYALDYIAQKHLGEESHGKTDFGKLTEQIKIKNRRDVERMVKIEEKFKLLPYYDAVRRLSKVEWEDLIWNSRTIDMLLLQEAKKQGVALPMKQKENEKEDFEGAYREAFKTGAFYGVGKYDLTSAYPFAIINFCLDPANVREQKEKNTIFIDNTHFKQNPNALLPIVVNKLMTLKNDIKQKLSTLDIKSGQYKDTKLMYDAIKSIVNSAYGVMGNRFFRLYDKRVASATPFLVRDLLKYTKDKIAEKGYDVIYADTDSVFIQSEEDLTDILNEIVQEWGKEKYGKESVNIEFDYEGQFEKLLILTKCRYFGYINKGKGIEEEIKGVEAKRKDSTIFMKKFQRELIDMILKKHSKEDIFEWINMELAKIQNTPLHEIAFPCKLARHPSEYKNLPIFVRALNNSPNYEKKVGDPFYYIYMNGKDDSGKDLVMAFDEDSNSHIHKNLVNWELMIKRNITMKLDTIFEAMGWEVSEVIYEEKKTRKRKSSSKGKKKVDEESENEDTEEQEDI